jgi:two-component system, cell cycle sensor histidine kinase and response regulator CckA
MAEVLIVEDDEQVRVMAESVLQEAGHTVVAATGVDGARALLNTDRHFDVLFIDLNLGHDLEAGLRVAKDAQERRPKLSYLYTTGAGVNEGMKALFIEPFLFLPKPYTMEQLTKSVGFLLRAPTLVLGSNYPSRPRGATIKLRYDPKALLTFVAC